MSIEILTVTITVLEDLRQLPLEGILVRKADLVLLIEHLRQILLQDILRQRLEETQVVFIDNLQATITIIRQEGLHIQTIHRLHVLHQEVVRTVHQVEAQVLVLCPDLLVEAVEVHLVAEDVDNLNTNK